MLPHSKRKVERKKSYEKQWFSGHAHRVARRGFTGEAAGSSSILMWSATCSRSNHMADRLYPKEHLHPALVTSFLSRFKSSSKSSFIERISGKAQDISEVQIITLAFFYLWTLTQKEKERLSSCLWKDFIMDNSEPAVLVYALPHVICQTQGGFLLTSDVSHSAAEQPFQARCLTEGMIPSAFSSKTLLPWGAFTSSSHHSITVHCPSFVPIRPLLHPLYSAVPEHFHSGTAEVRELQSRGSNNPPGKDTGKHLLKLFSTRESMSSSESSTLQKKQVEFGLILLNSIKLTRVTSNMTRVSRQNEGQ